MTEKALDQTLALAKSVAHQLAAEGYSTADINVALKAALPAINTVLAMYRRMDRLERRVRTLIEIREPRGLTVPR